MNKPLYIKRKHDKSIIFVHNINLTTMKKLYFLLLLPLFFGKSQAQTYTLDSTVLTSRNVISGIDIPWEIIWGPDNYIWMTERYGRVSRVNPQTGAQTVILNLTSSIYQQSESGLLGMMLHPDFTNQPYVYLVYTYLSGNNIRERLVRYSYNGTSLVSPSTLLENIVANTTHDGSRLMLLPDNTFLMTTGDAQNTNAPQNVNSFNGKTLRFNLDGTIPSDNPNPASYVYTWGHRNAQGLCLGPNNKIYCSEHGPTTDDELHIIEKGRNYGWPTIVGMCDAPNETVFCSDSNVVEPLASWTPTIAPSDIIWYNHPSIPEFNNKLLMTVLKDKRLIAFGFNSTGDAVVSENHYLTGLNTRLRDICVSPNGKIYLATNGASWSNTTPFTHRIVELYNASFVPSHTNQIADPLFHLFPNPVETGQTLTIETTNSNDNQLLIFDTNGRKLIQKEFENQLQMTCDFLPGFYHYQLISKQSGSVKTGKFIVR